MKTPKAVLFPGSIGFTAVTSMAIGMTALAIDSILPAFDSIREELGLEPGATELTLLISAFLLGFGIGQLPAGLLADRFGRRPVLWGGVALYIFGALVTTVSPTLWAMVAARFVWGLGAAGPRVAVTAMVRDAFEGEAMAKQMSTIMAVFLLVPMFAPSAGAALVALGSWKLTIWMCMAVGLVVLGASTRLPATLPAEDRRPLNVKEVVSSWRVVLAAPGTVAYLVAITLATGVFLSYLASSENIFDAVFDLEDLFPVLFGVLAFAMAIGAILNGRIVERVGLDRMLLVTNVIYVVSSVVMVVIAVMGDGTPEFAAFAPVMLVVMVAGQVTLINANTAAMVPLGRVAGSGAAVLGTVPLVLGSLIGSAIDQQFDGSITPLSVAFLAASIGVFFAVRYAAKAVARSQSASLDQAPVVSAMDCPEVGVGG